MTLYLVRARLRRDASVAALAPLLLPEDANARALAAHRLVWSLMPADAGATRDFLWREEGPGRFMLLAARAPTPSALFDVESRPFQPVLAAGDRLHFVLRANPTVARRVAGQRGKREDVVMHALHALPGKRQGGRDVARPEKIVREGTAWLLRLGQRQGFAPDPARLAVDGYNILQISRAGGAPPIRLATLDYQGVLTVTDPAAFLAGLSGGFGRGRAFGCGLMLIRRAGGS
jgi:CRISPR system Cascade subunit CasE